MPFDPDRHQRRSVRLHGFDYRRPGAYFLTLCCHRRACIFGRIQDGIFSPSPLGSMVKHEWKKIPEFYDCVALDAFVLMPNHLHMLLILPDPFKPTWFYAAKNANSEQSPPQRAKGLRHGREECLSIPDLVQRFKSFTTNEYRRRFGATAGKSKNEHLWQRNYYEHIIHDLGELNLIREYVERNSLQWEIDRDNPMCQIEGGWDAE